MDYVDCGRLRLAIDENMVGFLRLHDGTVTRGLRVESDVAISVILKRTLTRRLNTDVNKRDHRK